MGLELEYIKGQTPIEEEEKEELKIKTISTRGELDELLYKTSFVIDQTNAWIDAFKAIMGRFETNDLH